MNVEQYYIVYINSRVAIDWKY